MQSSQRVFTAGRNSSKDSTLSPTATPHDFPYFCPIDYIKKRYALLLIRSLAYMTLLRKNKPGQHEKDNSIDRDALRVHIATCIFPGRRKGTVGDCKKIPGTCYEGRKRQLLAAFR